VRWEDVGEGRTTTNKLAEEGSQHAADGAVWRRHRDPNNGQQERPRGTSCGPGPAKLRHSSPPSLQPPRNMSLIQLFVSVPGCGLSPNLRSRNSPVALGLRRRRWTCPTPQGHGQHGGLEAAPGRTPVPPRDTSSLLVAMEASPLSFSEKKQAHNTSCLSTNQAKSKMYDTDVPIRCEN